MSRTHDAQPTVGASCDGRPARRRRFTSVALLLVAMGALGVILLPSAAEWWASAGHRADTRTYSDSVQALPSADRSGLLARAAQYNATMPRGLLRDPYSAGRGAGRGADREAAQAAYADYLGQLAVEGTTAVGSIDYPDLHISLPIRLGTSESALLSGAGHIYGSSLPVGGPSTHTVLTSHSGLIRARLFSDLENARTGQLFSITVLGQTRHYRVDGIDVVLPDQTDSLQIVPGEDRVTLVTCTPTPLNSHRLLVHAIRVPSPAGADTTVATIGGNPGFPWWIVIFVGGSAAMGYVIFGPVRRRRS